MFQIFKKDKVKLYITYPFLILFVVLFIHSKPFSFDFSISLDNYLYSSWLFDYRYGFMQRGLIGEILSVTDISKDYNNIRIITISIFLILYYTLYLLIIKTLKKIDLKVNDITLYTTCFFFCSFTLSQFTLEIARFDQIFQVLSLFFLMIILKKNNIYISSLYIILLIPFITLTHEAGIIIFLPTILTIFYIEYRKLKPIISISILAIISIGLISYLGKINSNQVQKLIDHYYAYKGFNEFAFRTTSLSLHENLLMNWHSFIDNKIIIPFILCLIIIHPVLRFIITSINKKNYILFFIFTMSPLSLSFIAFDYFRWISLFIFNTFVLFTYLVHKDLIKKEILLQNLIKNKNNIIIYSLLSLFLGPLGIVNLYPHIHKNNEGGLSSTHLSEKIQEKLNYIK